MKGIKIRWSSHNTLTGANIYTIEITKERLSKMLSMPGTKVVFPIAVFGEPPKVKRKQ